MSTRLVNLVADAADPAASARWWVTRATRLCVLSPRWRQGVGRLP